MKTGNRILPIDLGGVNSYLITTDGGFILVDTGGHLTTDRVFDNRREALMKSLKDFGCVKGSLRLLLLTHGDNDHAANAAYLREKLGGVIAIHPADLDLVENPTLPMMMAGFRYRSAELQAMYDRMKTLITGLTQKTLADFEKFHPDILLADGLSMEDYGVDAKVVHLPGHTAGSVGLLFSDGSFLSGDTLVNVGKPSSAINATDFDRLDQSLLRLRKMDIRMVYPGHGAPFAFADWNE